jgi:hypothetical protein
MSQVVDHILRRDHRQKPCSQDEPPAMSSSVLGTLRGHQLMIKASVHAASSADELLSTVPCLCTPCVAPRIAACIVGPRRRCESCSAAAPLPAGKEQNFRIPEHGLVFTHQKYGFIHS